MLENIKGKCGSGHLIEVEYSRNKKGVEIIDCPECGQACEVNYMGRTLTPYHHPAPLRFTNMSFG